MSNRALKEKFGIVILLDALGAANFSTQQIKTFLSARAEVNSIVRSLAKTLPKQIPNGFKRGTPVIFTFGDTLVTTIAIETAAEIPAQITVALLLMRRYLFHSLQRGVLFRGSFAIGRYIADARSNTVMGEAVADAANWYERADWMGLCATPKTCTESEYYLSTTPLKRPSVLLPYAVPLKDQTTHELYCVSWPGAFFDEMLAKSSKESTLRRAFWAILKELTFPLAATSKYENAKRFFSHVEQQIVNLPVEPTLPS